VDRVAAIRDGKTSSERIRRVLTTPEAVANAVAELGSKAEAQAEAGEAPQEQPAEPMEEQVTYHEYVVIDAAGRLQIPREYLEKLGITDRAQVELVEEGILIKPAVGLEGVTSQTARIAEVAEHWGPQRHAKDWRIRVGDAGRGLRGLIKRNHK